MQILTVVDELLELARLKDLTAEPLPMIDLGRYSALEQVAC